MQAGVRWWRVLKARIGNGGCISVVNEETLKVSEPGYDVIRVVIRRAKLEAGMEAGN